MSRFRRYTSSKNKETAVYTFDWFGTNRTMCDALEDMRKCLESLNLSPLKGLIEEAQIMANRMESALSDQRDLVKLSTELSKARRAYKQLGREYDALNEKVKLKRPKKTEAKS